MIGSTIRAVAAMLFLSPLLLNAQPIIQLVPFASGFDRPVDITHAGDSRLFVVEQDGYIWVLDSLGNRQTDPFLDIDGRVRSSGNEQGLLGLAFHPNYADNGYFFVNYTQNLGGDTRVSRFSRDSINPNLADPNSEVILLEIDQPFNNHNAGCIKFGPDGYLYITSGDGGSGGDPQNNGQKTNTLLGKILRIDIDVDTMPFYRVPDDNPFVDDPNYLPEIWSLGWRNPWRISFDALTGDLWVADVGQDTREEIDFEPAGAGGRNYGWRCYEGNVPFNTSGCLPASSFVDPVFDYDNASLGCSVTGGFVYRGSQYSELYGKYIFTDFCSGRWWVTSFNAADSTYTTDLIANLSDFEYSSLGEDINGELYVAELSSGRILHIEELCSGFEVSGTVAGAPLCNNASSGQIDLEITGGEQPLSIQWSDGNMNEDRDNLGPGTYSVVVSDDNTCSRALTFELESLNKPEPVLSTNRPVVCQGESVVLTASNLSPPVTLTWLVNASLFETVTVTDSLYTLSSNVTGDWVVSFFDSTCMVTKGAELFVELDSIQMPEITGSGDSLVYTGGNIPGNYQWYKNNQMIPGANDWYYLYDDEGPYFLEVTSENGCVYQSNTVDILISTHIPEAVVDFSLAPNPVYDQVQFFLELDRAHRIQVSMFDTSGRTIFSQTRQGSVIRFPIQMQALPSGIYQLTVEMEGQQWSRKVVKR